MEIRRIPGHPPYEISEYGDVYRRLNDGSLRPLKTWPATNGYPTVRLGAGGRNLTVNSLVALTFIGPRPHDGSQVCHFDGNINNNHVSNLRYVAGAVISCP